MGGHPVTPIQSILLAFIAFVWLIATPIMYFAPMVHGSLFPVVSMIDLENPRPSPPPDYRYVWSGSADKYRNCDFIKVSWFLGRRDGRAVEVSAEFLDPPQVRARGVLHWDSLMIALDPTEVTSNSFAYVYHDCGFPWEVRTVFYDAALDKGKNAL